jgi:hypothetical protein
LAGVVGLVFAALAAHLELIDRGMRPSLAALVVALAAMICAAGLTAYVLAALRAFSPIPTRTIGMMRKNFELLQPGRARVNDDI